MAALGETRAEAIAVDAAELWADPFGALARYREQTPVIRVGESYYVLRGPDVLALQKDRRMQQIEGEVMLHRGFPREGNMWRLFANTVLMSNGKVHVRRRSPAVDTFSRRMIARLRGHVAEEARTLAAGLPRGAAFDLADAFSGPLPGRIIAHVVGIDPNRWRYFASLVYTMTQGLAPPFPAERWDAIEDAAGLFYGFIAEAIADRRAAPRDDFLTAYIAACDAAGEMDEEELLIQAVGFVLAGADTTRGGITSIVGQLLEERSRWEAVLADRSLVTAAVREALRLDPPVGGSPRMTGEDVDIGGVVIPALRPVDLLTISAMRDPALYADPERFDLHRTDGPVHHPIFGGGVHRCLGEQLAMAEMEEGLIALLDAMPDLRLAEPREPLRGFTAVREVTPLLVTT